MHTTDGIWLTITDYSNYKKVSISTIRRHIKSNLLKFKEEGGKYFIYVRSAEKLKSNEQEDILRARLENELLKSQIRQLREENDGLRMLVDIYEKRGDTTLPELPVHA